MPDGYANKTIVSYITQSFPPHQKNAFNTELHTCLIHSVLELLLFHLFHCAGGSSTCHHPLNGPDSSQFPTPNIFQSSGQAVRQAPRLPSTPLKSWNVSTSKLSSLAAAYSESPTTLKQPLRNKNPLSSTSSPVTKSSCTLLWEAASLRSPSPYNNVRIHPIRFSDTTSKSTRPAVLRFLPAQSAQNPVPHDQLSRQ